MVSCENFSAPGRYERQVFIVISNSILYSSTPWSGWNSSSVILACCTLQHFITGITKKHILKALFAESEFSKDSFQR